MLMSRTKKITCIVTGKQTIYSGDFLQKKIDEYGTLEKLNDLYICREVKSFLKRGYKILDIRKILNVDDSTALPDEATVNNIEKTFCKTSILKEHPTFNETLTSFTYNKSDPDVEQFIKEYIITV